MAEKPRVAAQSVKIRTCTCIIAAIILTQNKEPQQQQHPSGSRICQAPHSQRPRKNCWLMGQISPPKCPPIGKYTAGEQTCLHLTQGEAEELHAEVKAVIKKIHPLGLKLLGKNRRPSRS